MASTLSTSPHSLYIFLYLNRRPKCFSLIQLSLYGDYGWIFICSDWVASLPSNTFLSFNCPPLLPEPACIQLCAVNVLVVMTSHYFNAVCFYSSPAYLGTALLIPSDSSFEKVYTFFLF